MLSLDQGPFDQSMCAQGLWLCIKALALLHLPLGRVAVVGLA